MAENSRWTGGTVLAALPVKSGCITLDQLVEKTGLDRERARVVVDRLNRAGLVMAARRGCYRRTAAGDAAVAAGLRKTGAKGPTGSSRTTPDGLPAKLWSALRVVGKGTLPDLAEIADAACNGTGHGYAYLAALVRHGIVVVSGRRVREPCAGGKGLYQYILLRDLGPHAPIWDKRTCVLTDPNRGGAVIPPVEADRE